MNKITNKTKAMYLTWGLIHFILLFSPKEDGEVLNWGGRIFYPFTKGEAYTNNWNASAYDLTEFLFYMIAPILIYYIITLFFSKDETNK
jgi:hypothetical protein